MRLVRQVQQKTFALAKDQLLLASFLAGLYDLLLYINMIADASAYGIVTVTSQIIPMVQNDQLPSRPKSHS